MNNAIRLVAGFVAMGCTVALGALVEISEYRRYKTQQKLDVAEANQAAYKLLVEVQKLEIRNLQDQIDKLENKRKF